ncbi:MAG: bifunctional helix-turn-helix transcriptional regulator/GNAT family N-acetyltransferase [Vampirovibrionales bacterium]
MSKTTKTPSKMPSKQARTSVPSQPLEALDFLDSLQELALATRLKQLSEQFIGAWTMVYQTQSVPFEPSWFLVMMVLSHFESLSLVAMADHLKVSHSAVSQLVSELTKQGLVTTQADPKDKRKRLVGLTDEGRRVVEILTPVWADMQQVIRELILSTGYDLMDVLGKTEKALETYPLSNRFYDQLVARQTSATQIVPYSEAYRADFEDLNRRWLEAHFEVEPIDQAYFDDPKATILDRGGHIFMALVDLDGRQQVAGTCALLPTDTAGLVEFGKMGVADAMQGRGVGELLVKTALDQAKADGYTEIYLEMNSRFIRSVQLYRKFGFVLAPFDGAPRYGRSDLLLKRSL